MDLREKPGKIQKMMEFLLRLRLIFVMILVVLSVIFAATRWQAMSTLPLAASESMGMWLAELQGFSGFWASAQYLSVAAIAMIVLHFVFTSVKGGIAGFVGFVGMIGAVFALAGSDGMQFIFLGAFAVVALILLLAAKWSAACVLFPFALSWVFLTGTLNWTFVTFGFNASQTAVLWTAFSVIGFSSALAFAFSCGGLLGSGNPQAGSIVRAAKKAILPVTISSLLALVAILVDSGMVDGMGIGKTAALWAEFNVWFFAFLIPTSSFAPWERLRSKSRRVEMKKGSSKKNSSK